MLILTNCLIKNADEGSINVAYNLIKRIKSTSSNVRVVSYERTSELTDVEMKLNKLMLSIPLFNMLRKEKNVLYVPFPTRTLPAALRIWILSLFCKNLNVLISMHGAVDKLSVFLLKICKAKLFVVSEKAYKDFFPVVGNRVTYLKTGVDTKKFHPVEQNKKISLRKKYGVDETAKVVLHVGHLNKGRNIQQLLKLSDEYFVVLVTSSFTKNEQDKQLKEAFVKRKNTLLIDTYIENIEEIYQLSDLYLFPVVEEGNCIDVPLSVLEAASCGIPVLTTEYGEAKVFKDNDGFSYISSFENINKLVNNAINTKTDKIRNAVSEYDWNNAIIVLSR